MADPANGIRLSVPSDKRYLGPVRKVVEETLTLAGMSEEETSAVVLAVQEACANVIRHCYADCETKRVDVSIELADDRIVIRIDDYGKFVDPATMKGRDLDDVRPGGLGLHLIQKAMDTVEYRKNSWGGTTLELVKRLPPAEPEAR